MTTGTAPRPICGAKNRHYTCTRPPGHPPGHQDDTPTGGFAAWPDHPATEVRLSEAVATFLDTRSHHHRDLADFIVAHEDLIVRAVEREAERLSADPKNRFTWSPRPSDSSGAWGEAGTKPKPPPEVLHFDHGASAHSVAQGIRRRAADVRGAGHR